MHATTVPHLPGTSVPPSAGFVRATDLLDHAVRLNRQAFERLNVRVERQYAPNTDVLIDGHRVLQILISLVRNARTALEQAGDNRRHLALGVTLHSDCTQPSIRFVVAHTGVAVTPEHITKVFEHGSTTTLDGQIIGLHRSASMARELGGRLSGTSGAGGAQFTLAIPVAVETGHPTFQ
jgi:C4-dicarboxylate-specific signal transduction histidine kinase